MGVAREGSNPIYHTGQVCDPWDGVEPHGGRFLFRPMKSAFSIYRVHASVVARTTEYTYAAASNAYKIPQLTVLTLLLGT
jgi:hypothetical protein